MEGKYRWAFDGRRETEAPPFVEEIVLGHQFHSQILFFDRLHPRFGAPKAARFQGKECLAVASDPETPHRIFYYLPEGPPLGMESVGSNRSPITFVFDGWRMVGTIELPFTIWIDDGERKFTYHYAEIILNEGSMAPFRAGEHVLTEEQRLLRMHRRIMDDHFFGGVAGMKSVHADSVVIVADGELYRSSGSESEARFEQMLTTRDYTVYDDLVRPMVKVSADGSQGWVIAQVSAKGVRFDAQGKAAGQLEFVSAWIELYEKKDGRWRMVGNVSNFRPGRK